MARKKPAPYRGPHTEGRFEAVRVQGQTYPWRVVSGKLTVCVVQSGRPRADAERIAACLNALEGVPTEEVAGGLVARLWLNLRHLADLHEGVALPIPEGDVPAFRAQVQREAREALAAMGRAPPQGGA